VASPVCFVAVVALVLSFADAGRLLWRASRPVFAALRTRETARRCRSKTFTEERMDYPVVIAGFEDHEIAVRSSPWAQRLSCCWTAKWLRRARAEPVCPDAQRRQRGAGEVSRQPLRFGAADHRRRQGEKRIPPLPIPTLVVVFRALVLCFTPDSTASCWALRELDQHPHFPHRGTTTQKHLLNRVRCAGCRRILSAALRAAARPDKHDRNRLGNWADSLSRISSW